MGGDEEERRRPDLIKNWVLAGRRGLCLYDKLCPSVGMFRKEKKTFGGGVGGGSGGPNDPVLTSQSAIKPRVIPTSPF